MLCNVVSKMATSEKIRLRCVRMPGCPVRVIANNPMISVSEIFSADLNQLLLMLRASVDRCSSFGNKVKSFKHKLSGVLGRKGGEEFLSAGGR